MKPSRRKVVAGVACLALASLGGGGYALAGGLTEDQKESPDKAISGSALDKASEAALAATGGGEVTGTEVGDEESYYEVEVTKNGTSTDVQL
ncbi:MAG: hypothetical protein JWM90_1536, partial [Thermoleophilia bacterium]|nr:hypothetical protein [Thermoleophilia bacterium]